MKTHRHNVLLGIQPNQVQGMAEEFFNRAIYMKDRQESKNEFINDLNKVYNHESSEYILVRGLMGSGKSLFIRRGLYDFINDKPDLIKKLW